MASPDKNPGRPVGGPRLSDPRDLVAGSGLTFEDVGEHDEWHRPTAAGAFRPAQNRLYWSCLGKDQKLWRCAGCGAAVEPL